MGADVEMLQYETASRRFYGGQDVPVLLCLCRAWYAKANKDQSFSAMSTALQYAQKVRRILESYMSSALLTCNNRPCICIPLTRRYYITLR